MAGTVPVSHSMQGLSRLGQAHLPAAEVNAGTANPQADLHTVPRGALNLDVLLRGHGFTETRFLALLQH